MEYIRQGKEVGEACRLGIARLEALVYTSSSSSTATVPSSSSSSKKDEKMHDKLTVGVVAMDIYGNVGAASTIDNDNTHRGKPYFPVASWRRRRINGNSYDIGDTGDDGIHFIQASRDGAQY